MIQYQVNHTTEVRVLKKRSYYEIIPNLTGREAGGIRCKPAQSLDGSEDNLYIYHLCLQQAFYSGFSLEAGMAERRSQSQPFRFWLPAWSNPRRRRRSTPRPPLPTPQKSLRRDAASASQQQQPSNHSGSSSPSSPTATRRFPQPSSPSPASSRNPPSSRPQSRNANEQQRSRPRSPHPSPINSDKQAAVARNLRSRSALPTASTQVKSRLSSQALPPDSQSSSPAKRTSPPSNRPLSSAHESQPTLASASPAILHPISQARAVPLAKDSNPKPTRTHTLREPKTLLLVSTNSLEKTPLESYSISLPQLSTPEEQRERIKLEETEPSRSRKLEDTNKQTAEEKHKLQLTTNHHHPKNSYSTPEGSNRDKLKTTPDTEEKQPFTGERNKSKEQGEVVEQLSTTSEKRVITSPTQNGLVSLSINSNAEHRKDTNTAEHTKDGSTREERKIAISTIPQDSFYDGKRAVFKEEIEEGLSKLLQKIGAGYSGGARNGLSTNVITLAGNNSGASMIIGYEGADRQNSYHAHKGQKLDKEKVDARGSCSEEKWQHSGKGTFTTSINNNVQSINNSAVDESSCSVRNPGVHLNLSRINEPLVSERTVEPLETGRTASKPIQSQKPTREPRIRRRCLRALLMESSESDPEKPRRHGCRYSCEEKKKLKG
ncbi:hypothetical protein GW17_00043818 [Ensete ventricosum]|nr:hypothetical protein GW17_00043818 [Ensete ventricosum]